MILVNDYLGGANYGNLIRRHHPKGMGAGVILNTNKPHWPKTNAWPVFQDLADKGEGVCPLMRFHGLWNDSHQYRPNSDDKIIFAELDKAGIFADKYPHVDCYFSPICELDTSGVTVDKLFARLNANMNPKLTLVNSVSKGRYRNDAINEFHGSKKPPSTGVFGYSYDGSQCWDRDIQGDKDRFSHAIYIAYWVSMFNGKWNDKAKGEQGADTTPRPDRKAWPYPEVFPSLGAYQDDASEVSLASKHTWKTHADQHGPKRQPREGKPVFITPLDAKEVKLITFKDQLVATLPRTGNFTDGRPLYRASQFGFQLANKAKALSGSSYVKIVGKGGIIGIIHPAFRAGTYR